MGTNFAACDCVHALAVSFCPLDKPHCNHTLVQSLITDLLQRRVQVCDCGCATPAVKLHVAGRWDLGITDVITIDACCHQQGSLAAKKLYPPSLSPQASGFTNRAA
jgi:hypothetical protein